MKDPVFENLTYGQQANSLKMRVNWIVSGVNAHMRKGKQQRKTDVSRYPAKVVRQLELVIGKLRRMR
jgi:hypothetical protein